MFLIAMNSCLQSALFVDREYQLHKQRVEFVRILLVSLASNKIKISLLK